MDKTKIGIIQEKVATIHSCVENLSDTMHALETKLSPYRPGSLKETGGPGSVGNSTPRPLQSEMSDSLDELVYKINQIKFKALRLLEEIEL